MQMRSFVLLCAALAAMCSAAANASAPAAVAAADRASSAACIRASGLKSASAGPVARFSDSFGVDARTVTGIWPQARMNGERGTMLCLYDRRSRRAETQEVAGSVAPVPATDNAGLKDVFWQVAELDGRRPIGRRPLSLMLGSDGKLGGNSGCNGYSVNYQLTGLELKVYPPMIGTRMACGPAVTAQESLYREILESARSLTRGPAGSLILKAADGRAIRLVRQPR